jgi:hypothetical protein
LICPCEGPRLTTAFYSISKEVTVRANVMLSTKSSAAGAKILSCAGPKSGVADRMTSSRRNLKTTKCLSRYHRRYPETLLLDRRSHNLSSDHSRAYLDNMTAFQHPPSSLERLRANPTCYTGRQPPTSIGSRYVKTCAHRCLRCPCSSWRLCYSRRSIHLRHHCGKRTRRSPA